MTDGSGQKIALHENWKTYLVLSIIVPSIVTLTVFFISKTPFNTLIFGLITFVTGPMAFAGIYMMITGGGYRFLNIGINWIEVGDEKARNISSHYGIFMVITSIGMMAGIALMTTMKFELGLGILIGSLVLMLLPLAFYRKMLNTPRRHYDKSTSVLLIVLCTLLIVLPSCYFGSATNGGNVSVEMGGDSFTVKAPTFDHTFRYADVDGIEIVDNFDFGTRQFGYAGMDIVSGKWRNDIFGEYELAAYRGNHRCITVSVDGSMYAFNKENAADTTALYEQLKAKISP